MAGYGLFGHATPVWLIFAALLAGGFFRSLEFTSINAIAYADIDNRTMSRATSFASVAQQLSISSGVAVGAAVIETAQAASGDPVLTLQRFRARVFHGRRDLRRLGPDLRPPLACRRRARCRAMARPLQRRVGLAGV